MSNREELICQFLSGSLPEERLIEIEELLEDPAFADELVQSGIAHELLIADAALKRDESCAKVIKTLFGQDHIAIREHHAPPVKTSGLRRIRFSRKSSLFGTVTIVAVLLLAFLLKGKIDSKIEEKRDLKTTFVAHITSSVNAQWKPGCHRWSVGDALRSGDRIELSDGRFEIIYSSGAVMTLVGPVALEIRSPRLASLEYGTATTRVDNDVSGDFQVLTPLTTVVDLGTEFGVSVKPDGTTTVAVFDGAVDLRPLQDESSDVPVRRLTGGQAVKANKAGAWERLVFFDDETFPFGSEIFRIEKTRPAIISRITDNRRSSDSPTFYRICHESLDEDSRAYVDRVHEWNGMNKKGLPYFLRGADYVQTFNSDKKDEQLSITVDITGPAMLYLFYDDRLTVPPWLSDTFEDTGQKIGMDEGPWKWGTNRFPRDIGTGAGQSIDRSFSIWKRRIDKPMSVELGPTGDSIFARDNFRSMFGIAAKPIE